MTDPRPPKWPLLFFRWYCRPEYLEDIEGDLLERFDHRLNNNERAHWLFTLDVLKLMRPGIIRQLEGTQKLNNYGMVKTMFTIAWRNALRQKQFTILNLLGLVIGISTCLVISLYIYNELTYDTFHTQGDRIYRINQPNIWGDWDVLSSSTGPNVAIALREDAPEFEQVTRILSSGPQVVRTTVNGEDHSIFQESLFFAAEDNFLKVFSFDFIAGDPTTALSDPFNILLTEETAKRYFGEDMHPNDIIDRKVEVKAKERK